MGYRIGADTWNDNNWINFPNTYDYSGSIQQLMTAANADASKKGFTVDNRGGVWKYKLLQGEGTIIPNSTGHTYLKSGKDNSSRVNYYEYDGGAFSFTYGRNLLASAITYTNESEVENCANKSMLNSLSRGFVYDPNTGDCFTAGDTDTLDFAGANYPMPTGPAVGYMSGWKTNRPVLNTVYGNSFFSQIKSIIRSDGEQFFFTCEPTGELRLTKSDGTLLWSNHVYTGQGCKARVENWNGGRVAVYDNTNTAIWTSNDGSGTTNQARLLEIGDDGVVRLKTVANLAEVLWNTNDWFTNRIEIDSSKNQWTDRCDKMSNGDYKLSIQPDGKIVIIKISTGGVIWNSTAVGSNYRMVFDGNDLTLRDPTNYSIYKWANGRGNSYYPAGKRTLYLTTTGELQMFHGTNLVWSSVQWAPRDYHFGRSTAKLFRIMIYENSKSWCLVPGAGNGVYWYNDTQPMSNQANWLLETIDANQGHYRIRSSTTGLYLGAPGYRIPADPKLLRTEINNYNLSVVTDTTIKDYYKIDFEPVRWRVMWGPDSYSLYLQMVGGSYTGYRIGLTSYTNGDRAVLNEASSGSLLNLTW